MTEIRIVVCDKCGINLFEEIPGTNQRRIFRSFATKDDKHYCINCYEHKGVSDDLRRAEEQYN